MTDAARVRYDERAAAFDVGLFMRRTTPGGDKEERETGEVSMDAAP
jgi:hypothetical protein